MAEPEGLREGDSTWGGFSFDPFCTERLGWMR